MAGGGQEGEAVGERALAGKLLAKGEAGALWCGSKGPSGGGGGRQRDQERWRQGGQLQVCYARRAEYGRAPHREQFVLPYVCYELSKEALPSYKTNFDYSPCFAAVIFAPRNTNRQGGGRTDKIEIGIKSLT